MYRVMVLTLFLDVSELYFDVDVGAFVFMLRVSSRRTCEMPFVSFVWYLML